MQIKLVADRKEKIAFILPAGSMGMYKWTDGEGNTLPSDNVGAFQYAMEQTLFDPLGELTVPAGQRDFATTDNTYPEKIAVLKSEGAKLVLVYGIGRMCHFASWKPTFAADYASAEEWAKAPYRTGARIHPLTSFKSRTTLVPCRANTIISRPRFVPAG